jgi:LAO/AO transport system kinase
MTVEQWAQRIQAGDPRSVARAISAIESGESASVLLLQRLFACSHKAEVIGITGSPGSGKSTLVEKLALAYRASGRRVAILAVDPSSPFSEGAILGDRIRMQRLATDEGIYIRSMATRGHLGGLAAATHDAVTVVAAAGFEIVLVETVGVGQDEVEVARLADTTVLLLAPEAGDDVQVLKAGVMEIADLFVINKADREGADRLEHAINSMLCVAPRQDGWQPPVLRTVATTGEGVNLLQQALSEFSSFGQGTQLRTRREHDRWRQRLLEIVRDDLVARVVKPRMADGRFDALIHEIVERKRDPHSAAEAILKSQLTNPMKLHHIGIAVESLEEAIPVFQKLLGSAPAQEETVEDQKSRVAVFEVGETSIELLEATAADSPVARFIAKRGPGIHHLTLTVANLAESLGELEQKGILLVDRAPRPGAGGHQIAFLHPKSTAGILVELMEE